MLCDELPEVPVFPEQDRVKSAKAAMDAVRDVLILDDGFQHRRICRDLNILLLDSVSLFGNGCMFPRGVLREPVTSIKRADLVVLTKIDMIDAGRKEEVVSQLKTLAPEKPVVTAKHKASFLADVTGAAYPVESLQGSKVFLVSGIVDPDYFEFLVKNAGATIAARRDYTDHHRYSQKDIDDMYNECFKRGFEKIIVTKKDFVKMKDLDISSVEDKLFILNIGIDIVEGKERLVAGLNSIYSG
jgi:tetraacyldisaccharide 4'-kinase